MVQLEPGDDHNDYTIEQSAIAIDQNRNITNNLNGKGSPGAEHMIIDDDTNTLYAWDVPGIDRTTSDGQPLATIGAFDS